LNEVSQLPVYAKFILQQLSSGLQNTFLVTNLNWRMFCVAGVS